MTIEEAIRDHLVADAGVDAIVDGRVWQLVLPEHGTLPAVRIQLIDEPRELHLRGIDNARLIRMQADSFVGITGADPYNAAVSLADAVEAALTPEPFTAGSSPGFFVMSVKPDDRRPFFEETPQKLVRMQQDFLIWYRA